MMAKLFFESIVGLFYKHVFTAPRETYRKTTPLGVTFALGDLAGLVCAVISHLDDLLVFMGKPENWGDGERDGHCSTPDAGLGHPGAQRSLLERSRASGVDA